VSEIRRQFEAERGTKEELQRKYDELRVQYDAELDNLNANKEQPQSQPTGSTKGKRKGGGILKPKRDEENRENTTGETNDESSNEVLDQKQKLERLQELENKLVGGEEANNEERRKKRKKKLNEMREKQEQRKRFNNAIHADDDDTLLKVFDNAQEQVNIYTEINGVLIEFMLLLCLVTLYNKKIRRTTNGKQTFAK